MSFQDLRRAIEGEIFDYQTLMHYLRDHKKPRDKVTLLLKKGSIVRIKKGLYIFGPETQRRSVSCEILANLIYGPSYISLQYALSKYGLIPERAYTITSICLPRSRLFHTPVGTFIYKTRSPSSYPIGITRIELPHQGGYLIGEPEKALVDLIAQEKKLRTVKEMQEYLYENMRMEQKDLRQLKKSFLTEILQDYQLPLTLVKTIYA